LWTFHTVEKRPHDDEFDPGRAAVTWFLAVNSLGLLLLGQVLVKHDEQLLSFVVSWWGQRMVEEEEWEKSHGVAPVEAVLGLFDEETESQANHLPCADDVSLLLLTHYSLFLNTLMTLRKKNCSNLTLLLH
jgi:hypothetical protein